MLARHMRQMHMHLMEHFLRLIRNSLWFHLDLPIVVERAALNNQ